jgi:hypothetical protein
MYSATASEVLIHLKAPLQAARDRLPLTPRNEAVNEDPDQPKAWRMFGLAFGLGLVATAVPTNEGIAIAVRPMPQATYDSVAARRMRI